MPYTFNPFTGKLDYYAAAATPIPSTYQDTEKNILALTPTKGLIAWATDLNQFMVADGTNWWIDSSYLAKDLQNPDMGWVAGSNRSGYGQAYITDKLLDYIQIGQNGNPVNGGLRFQVNPVTLVGNLQVYYNGTWYPAAEFTSRENSSLNYTLEHYPVGNWIQVYSGNSETVGFNGLPMIQGYKVSMGCYPFQPQIDGGTF